MKLSENQEAFDHSIAIVRERFKEKLIVRILNLEAAMIEIDSDEDLEPRLKLISSVAHKCAGVAPTLGFTELGALALQLEKEIDFYIGCRDKSAFWDRVRPKLDRMLDAMEEILET